MSFKNVRFRTPNTQRNPSPSVWAKCPILDILTDGQGIFFHDDFITPPHLVTPTITSEANLGNGYKAFGESPSTLLSVNPEVGGHFELLMSDDNEACTLATISAPFKIIRGGGDVWFETRIKTLNITADTLGWLVGMAALETLANDVPLVDAGTIATTTNFVGFMRPEGDGNDADAIYQANAVATVTHQADAARLVADTYIKLGFWYDDAKFKLHYYVNGTEVDAGAYSMPSAAGTDFPNDVQLGLICSILGANAADASVTMDWWRAAQRFPRA